MVSISFIKDSEITEFWHEELRIRRRKHEYSSYEYYFYYIIYRSLWIWNLYVGSVRARLFYQKWRWQIYIHAYGNGECEKMSAKMVCREKKRDANAIAHFMCKQCDWINFIYANNCWCYRRWTSTFFVCVCVWICESVSYATRERFFFLSLIRIK